MNYNELYLLLKQKGFTVKSICNQIAMTPNGFKRSIERKDFPWKSIEVLCNLISITPNQLIGWPEEPVSIGNYASHITGGNTQNSDEAIKALRDELKEKGRTINRLLSILEKMGSAGYSMVAEPQAEYDPKRRKK